MKPARTGSIKPMLIYPFFGILIMGAIMMFIIAPPVSALNGCGQLVKYFRRHLIVHSASSLHWKFVYIIVFSGKMST